MPRPNYKENVMTSPDNNEIDTSFSDLTFDPTAPVPEFDDFGAIPLQNIQTVEVPTYMATPDEVVFQVGHFQLVRLVRALQLSVGHTPAMQLCRLRIGTAQVTATSFNHLSLSEYKIDLVSEPQNLPADELVLVVAFPSLRNAAMGGQEFVTFVVKQLDRQLLVVSNGFERPIALEPSKKFNIPRPTEEPVWREKPHRPATLLEALSFVATFTEENENGRHIGYEKGTITGQSPNCVAIARFFQPDIISFQINATSTKSLLAALDLMSTEDELSFGTWEQYVAIQNSRFFFLVQKGDHPQEPLPSVLPECEILVPAAHLNAALSRAELTVDEDRTISLNIKADARQLDIEVHSENSDTERTRTRLDGALASGTITDHQWVLPAGPFTKAVASYSSTNAVLSRIKAGSQVIYRIDARTSDSGTETPTWDGQIYMTAPKRPAVPTRR